MPKYKKYDEATKNRGVRRFLQGEDWQITVRKNSIPLTTVRSWVKKKTIEEAREEAGEVVLTRTRGGARHVIITDEYNAFLEQRINENPGMTLKELQAKLQFIGSSKLQFIHGRRAVCHEFSSKQGETS